MQVLLPVISWAGPELLRRCPAGLASICHERDFHQFLEDVVDHYVDLLNSRYVDTGHVQEHVDELARFTSPKTAHCQMAIMPHL